MTPWLQSVQQDAKKHPPGTYRPNFSLQSAIAKNRSDVLFALDNIKEHRHFGKSDAAWLSRFRDSWRKYREMVAKRERQRVAFNIAKYERDKDRALGLAAE